jgi:hypothetical protein
LTEQYLDRYRRLAAICGPRVVVLFAFTATATPHSEPKQVTHLPEQILHFSKESVMLVTPCDLVEAAPIGVQTPATPPADAQPTLAVTLHDARRRRVADGTRVDSPPITTDSPPAGTQPLTALTPIIPGHRAQLQQVLAELAQRIGSGGATPLDEIGSVHFARWAVLATGHAAGSLLFTSNFDGPWDNYIEEFAAKSAPTFDAIYSHCQEWPPNGARDVDAFKAYVRKYEVQADVYYRAYPMATVRQVRSALRLKAATITMLDMLNE